MRRRAWRYEGFAERFTPGGALGHAGADHAGPHGRLHFVTERLVDAALEIADATERIHPPPPRPARHIVSSGRRRRRTEG